MFSPSDGLSVDTELVVGDKDQTAQLGDRSVQTAETINNIQDIPLWYILLFTLMAGWAIPAPGVMGQGLLSLIRALLPWGKK